jgi:uncharacterized protein YyaL (SSP411 family)
LARDIFDYVARELTNPEGAFYTAEDADSLVAADRPEHAEGAFYVWTASELRDALGENYPFVATHFGVEESGNVPAQFDPQGELKGRNILAQRRSLAQTAKELNLSIEQANEQLLAVLLRLREVRARRPRPHLDDKILTANNGLMISALARAHVVLELADPTVVQPAGSGEGPTTYLRAATRAAEFIERELYDSGRGVLFRTWREGRGTTPGFAEDYAFLIQGLLDLYEASFNARWLRWAERLQSTMDEQFWDEAQGGYFNSGANDPSIVLRLKEDYDGAEPAPSSIAAMNLLRLGAVFDGTARSTPEKRAGGAPALSYRDRGVRCIEAFRGQWTRAPQAMPQMLCALELALEPPRHVVLAGDRTAADFRALASVLHAQFGPRRVILAAGGGTDQRWLAERAPWLAEMQPRDGHATAYVCEEFACQAPVTDAAALERLLKAP